MGSKDTSESHQKLLEQATICKLAGIETNTWTAKARSSLLGVAVQQKKRRRVPNHPLMEQDPGPPGKFPGP